MGKRRTRRAIAPPIMASVGVIALLGCTRGLDMPRIEAAIQQDIEARGDIPVRWVECPRQVKVTVGEGFSCTAELSRGGMFTVQVTPQDELGNVTWEIPNSRAILNLMELQAYFKEQIGTEIGRPPAIDCGGVYRINQPGDRFECQVFNAIAPDQSRIETILVNVDTLGNVNWQQVRRQMVATTPGANEAATPATDPTRPNAAALEQPAPAVAPTALPKAPLNEFGDPPSLD